ncbi:hypothetical protein JQ580_16190 [Bradyrhizobium japonicum]|uniref:hypothetical protein n=1 Tax=Bradyrhizobium japonicum TaxID=375 RepID=UPI001BACC1CC|nr:hypothetical protein [Bradyrhizobium japonicum]MBR0992253.1 hypothetical protein [Bradyrhizobium japonicum]
MRYQDILRGAPAGAALSFLMESEQRVIAHCDRLLGTPDLPEQDRNRLLRLRGEAEARLGRLTFAAAA